MSDEKLNPCVCSYVGEGSQYCTYPNCERAAKERLQPSPNDRGEEPKKYIGAPDQQQWQEMNRSEKEAYLNPEWVKWRGEEGVGEEPPIDEWERRKIDRLCDVIAIGEDQIRELQDDVRDQKAKQRDLAKELSDLRTQLEGSLKEAGEWKRLYTNVTNK